MLSSKAGLLILFSGLMAVAPAFAATPADKSTAPAHKSATAAHTSHSGHKVPSKSKKSHKLHGQQAIEASRVMEIQQALIREHYLSGEPNGSWDVTTQAAMQKFQSDQGWQTKLLPDSRALKKLGLGPDYSSAINAEGASFTPAAPVSSIPSSQASGFAAASGVNQ